MLFVFDVMNYMLFRSSRQYTKSYSIIPVVNERHAGIQLWKQNKRKTLFYVTVRVKKEATAMDGGRFHAEAIFWFCQNSLSKVYMDVHFWRYFRFACINLLSKMYKGSTFFDSTALRANSQPSFFHAFLIYSGLSLFFHCWIPVLMRKVRVH